MKPSPVDAASVDTGPIEPVRQGNVFEETIERLLRMMRLGQVPPGARLPAERELAESLRVSRTTLREAIAELQSAGYVTVLRGRYGGAYVADVLPAASNGPGELDPATVEDLLTLREIVEPAAVRLAASRPLDGVDRERLTESARAAAACGPDQYRPLDSRLHLVLAELSGSPSLTLVVADVRSRVNEMLDRIPLLPPNLQHSTTQHDAIVAAVLAGDPSRAESAARDHLDGTAALLRGFLA